MDKCWKAIKKLDMYPIPISLHFNRSSDYSSRTGAVISILSWIVLAYGFIVYTKEYLNKQFPSISSISYQEQQKREIDLSSQEFLVAIGLQKLDSQEVYMDESIYQLEAWRTERKVVSGDQIEESRVKIELDKCKLSLEEKFSQHLTERELENLYCIKKDQENLILNKSTQSQFIEFSIIKCTGSSQCKSPDIINQSLQNSDLFMKFSDKDMFYNNYRHPIQSIIRELRIDLSDFALKNLNMVMRNVIIEDDLGYLTPDMGITNTFYIYDQIETFLRRKNLNQVIRVTFACDEFVDDISRIYRNVLSWLSDLGGYALVTTFIFEYLANWIGQQLLHIQIVQNTNMVPQNIQSQQKIIQGSIRLIDQKAHNRQQKNDPVNKNELTILQPSDLPNLRQRILQSAKNKDQNSSNGKPSNQNFQQSDTPLAWTNYAQIKQGQESAKIEVNKTQKITEQQINNDSGESQSETVLTFEDCVNLIFCPFKNQSQKLMLLKQQLENIKENLDITYILNKIMQFEKLKAIMLSNRQLILFRYITHPGFEEIETEQFQMQDQQSQSLNLLDLEETYKSKINLINGMLPSDMIANLALETANQMSNQSISAFTDIDFRIINSLHPDIQVLFQDQIKQFNGDLNLNPERSNSEFHQLISPLKFKEYQDFLQNQSNNSTNQAYIDDQKTKLQLNPLGDGIQYENLEIQFGIANSEKKRN